MILVTVTSIMSLTACGGGNTEEDAAAPAPPETVTVEKPPERAPAAEEPPAEKEPAGGKIKVPNVVGKDHQLAQDTMQEAGLYILLEEDATGQDRLLILDRNWTTVAQDPPAGTLVSEDQAITLKAKMDGE